MGLTLVGKNGNSIILSYNQAGAIRAVLCEILGAKVDLSHCILSESRIRAEALRNSIPKMRLITDDDKEHGYEILVVQGANLNRMLSERYSYMRFHTSPTWEMARELDYEWKETILGFIEFLEASGGISRGE